MKKLFLILVIGFFSLYSKAQTRFSFANDLSLLRNFSPQQKFFALGTTIQGNFHFAPTDGAYAWFSYYTPGRFSNRFMASAKSSSTTPQTADVEVKATWLFRNLSIGWKHYFKGAYNDETSWNLYGMAGFGLQIIKVQNEYNPAVDTSVYHFNGPAFGSKNVTRLSLDLGVGIEYPVAPDFYLYGDLRTWYPASNIPSPYFHDNEKTPMPVTIGIGFRLLFATY